MCIPSELALSRAKGILGSAAWPRKGKGEIITHPNSPDNRTLVFPSASKVFAVVAPLDVPYLISMYFQDCGCDVRET